MPDAFLDGSSSDPNCYCSGRCLRVGVLSNPRSGGNKKGGRGVRDVLARWPDVMQREACTPEEMAAALVDFARDEVELVVINGGDGTIHAVLTAIANTGIFAKTPALALLCAGTTSMLPRDAGFTGSPAKALQRILEWARFTNASLAVYPRPVLQVLRAPPHPPLYGMFFGAGAICLGIKSFHGRDNPMGWRGQLMPAFTMLRLLRAIVSGNRQAIPPLRTTTGLDGRQPETRMELLVLASTLEHLFLGMRPYWGKEAGPVHYTAIGDAPRHLLRVLPSVFRGQKSRHATAENGYFSHNVHEIRLDMAGDFTLDGELYTAGEGTVTLSASGPVLFLRPSA